MKELAKYMKHFWLIAFLLFSVSVFAQHSAHIRQLEQERKAALEDIRKTNRLLEKTTATQKDFSRRLALLSNQILSRKKVISLLNQEIKALNSQIVSKDKELVRLEKELTQKKENYGKSVRKMYHRHLANDKLFFVLSADNFAQSLRRIRYLREYADWQKRQAGDIVNKRTEIAFQKDALEKMRGSKTKLLSTREEEQKNLQSEENNRKEEIAKLNKQRSVLQVELNKKRKQAAELNRMIESAIAAEIRRAEEERKAREPKAEGDKKEERKSAVKGGYAMTRPERELSANFSANRGRLPFPVTGSSHQIVGHFGQHQYENLKFVRTENYGIDILASTGSDARAVFNGVVTKVFTVPGFNKSVIVRHGNYLTVYSNLSDVYVNNGDRITTRQPIGKIFMDPEDNNSTILHFQLWKERTKQNPEPWLSH